MRRIQFKSLTKNYRLDIINEHKNCIGEWLNGRATVSKTVGCVFESRLPCHEEVLWYFFFFCRLFAIRTRNAYATELHSLRLRFRVTLRFANFICALRYSSRLASSRIASPLPRRSTLVLLLFYIEYLSCKLPQYCVQYKYEKES